MDDPRASEHFIRVVGARRKAPAGALPPPESRAAMTQMAQYRTRVPKGIFRYRSHEEANRDWEQWTVDAMVARRNG